MYDTYVCIRRWAALALSALALTLAVARPAAAQAGPPMVALGSDYFQTTAGTFAVLPGIGLVDFVGNPIGPGNTDTIVQRQADAIINGPSIPIEIVALSLESAAPVNVGGSFFDVFVTLDNDGDPIDKGHNTGMMTITGTPAGGIFSSFFDVFFDVTLHPVGGGPNVVIPDQDIPMLSNAGAAWSSTPPPGALLVDGVDDALPAVQDQAANHHSNLDSNEVDFFVVNGVQEIAPNEAHNVTTTTVPEPSPLLVLAMGVVGTAGVVVRRRRA